MLQSLGRVMLLDRQRFEPEQRRWCVVIVGEGIDVPLEEECPRRRHTGHRQRVLSRKVGRGRAVELGGTCAFWVWGGAGQMKGSWAEHVTQMVAVPSAVPHPWVRKVWTPCAKAASSAARSLCSFSSAVCARVLSAMTVCAACSQTATRL